MDESTALLSSPTMSRVARSGDDELETDPSARTTIADSFKYSAFAALMLNGMVKPLCFDLILPFISRLLWQPGIPLCVDESSFSDQMILENGIEREPSKVGHYSGPIQSAFAAMTLIGSLSFRLPLFPRLTQVSTCSHAMGTYIRYPWT